MQCEYVEEPYRAYGAKSGEFLCTTFEDMNAKRASVHLQRGSVIKNSQKNAVQHGDGANSNGQEAWDQKVGM